MPISFEQPQPYDPSISEAYGRLQQQLANRQVGGGSGGGGGGFGPGVGGGNLVGGGGRDTYSGGQDFEGQVRAQLTLNQGALNQTEEMDLRRMDNARAQLNSDWEGYDLNNDEYKQALSEIMTPIQIYRQRQAAAQVQQTQAQTQALMQQNAQQSAMFDQSNSFHARSMADRTSTLQNPEVLAQVRREVNREDFDTDQEHEDYINKEVAARGGSQLMLQVAPNQSVPIFGNQAAGGTSGRSATTGAGATGRNAAPAQRAEPPVNELNIYKAALAHVRAGNPGLTGEQFDQKVDERYQSMLQQANDARAARQPAPAPEPPQPEHVQRAQQRTDIRTYQAGLDRAVAANPELQQDVFGLHQALDNPRRVDWADVMQRLQALPANVRSSIPMTPTMRRGLDSVPLGSPQQAVQPQAQAQEPSAQAAAGPVNPAMSTLGNMMNRGAPTPASEATLTPADQPTTMHSLLSDLESSRNALGGSPGLSPLARNFPNSTVGGVRQEHRALAAHRLATESYNDVIRTIREGNGELSDAQKETINRKIDNLAPAVQSRIRQYMRNPQRGEPRRRSDPATDAYFERLNRGG